MAKTSKKESVVQPIIRIENDKEHIMATLLDSKSAPEVKSVGVFHVPGTNNYVSFTMITKGNEVISIEVDEPNLRAIAEESAKINFVQTFMSGE